MVRAYKIDGMASQRPFFKVGPTAQGKEERTARHISGQTTSMGGPGGALLIPIGTSVLDVRYIPACRPSGLMSNF